MSSFKQRMKRAEKMERGIYHDPKIGDYHVNVGKFKQYVFPTLEQAIEFRDFREREMMESKKREASALIRRNEEKRIESANWKSDPYPFNAMRAVRSKFRESEGHSVSEGEFLGFVGKLGERNRRMLECYYGADLADDEPNGRALEDVAKMFGVSRQAVLTNVSRSLCRIAWMVINDEDNKDRIAKRENERRESEQLMALRAKIAAEWLSRNGRDLTPEIREAFGDVLAGVGDDAPIEDLDLSVRSANCLKRAGAVTLGQVAKMTATDLIHIRNMGVKSAREIIRAMESKGYRMTPGPDPEAQKAMGRGR